MTLPKKKSRRIEIEDRAFRWMLSGQRALDDGCEDSGQGRSAFSTATLTVQEDIENPGQVLRAVLQSHDRGPVVYGEALKAAVTPKDVKRLILAALARGWDPNGHGKGSVFKLEGPMALEDYEVI
jgi:hypothetical protein